MKVVRCVEAPSPACLATGCNKVTWLFNLAKVNCWCLESENGAVNVEEIGGFTPAHDITTDIIIFDGAPAVILASLESMRTYAGNTNDTSKMRYAQIFTDNAPHENNGDNDIVLHHVKGA
eukprot:scaffold60077_cov58-Attheya_sp.AAC.2